MAGREVVVEYKKSGPRQGERYAVKSAADAKKVHPDATIVEFHPSGEKYSDKKDTKAAEREAQPAVAAIEAAQKVQTNNG